MEAGIRKTILLVLDSLGVGEAPDSYAYGDRRANTLSHISEAWGGINIPNLARLGLSNLTHTKGAFRGSETTGFYGKVRPRSTGKDSIVGHWEMMGIHLPEGFNSYPGGFPEVFIQEMIAAINIDFVGNYAEVERVAFENLYNQHTGDQKLILLTSNESRMILMCHEDVYPREDFFLMAESIREVADSFQLAEVRAEVYGGVVGDFYPVESRTFLIAPQRNHLLQLLLDREIPVHAVGKIGAMFRGVDFTSSVAASHNNDVMRHVLNLIRDGDTNEAEQCLIFANFPDFDSLYAHRKDPEGYARALEEFDLAFPRILRAMSNEDLLIVTADHGGDPTFPDSEHTREHLPLLVFSRIFHPQGKAELGVRTTLADIAETICEAYEINAGFAAESFWTKLLSHL